MRTEKAESNFFTRKPGDQTGVGTRDENEKNGGRRAMRPVTRVTKLDGA